jgi:hypothetical protein
MEESARKSRICFLESLLRSRQKERAFLAQRCDCDDLSPVQRETLLSRIDHLINESNVLQSSIGMLQREPVK